MKGRKLCYALGFITFGLLFLTSNYAARGNTLRDLGFSRHDAGLD